jgi:hypothetical protein
VVDSSRHNFSVARAASAVTLPRNFPGVIRHDDQLGYTPPDNFGEKFFSYLTGENRSIFWLTCRGISRNKSPRSIDSSTSIFRSRHRADQLAKFIQHDWFKHANPAKARLREDASNPCRVVFAGT